jgi:hypothetical protein
LLVRTGANTLLVPAAMGFSMTNSAADCSVDNCTPPFLKTPLLSFWGIAVVPVLAPVPSVGASKKEKKIRILLRNSTKQHPTCPTNKIIKKKKKFFF